MTGPADEIAAGQGRWRASHADREQVVDALKAAFVQGRLTADELDERAGQALAARTYADLAALITDLPADPAPAPQPAPGRQPAPARRPQNTAASRAVKAGAGAIGVAMIALGAAIAVAGEPAAAAVIAVFMVVLAAVATAVVASLIHVALKLESRQRSRSRGQHPSGPEPGAGGHSAQHLQAPGTDPVRPPRPPHGLLATGLAG
ncbi:MAG TPA: DUF1707 domain-containing protein [Streptosporangiaceae bacterium]|nr:DUF1707 domain-containing protein [Streptosporangiaceae bacterium]